MVPRLKRCDYNNPTEHPGMNEKAYIKAFFLASYLYLELPESVSNDGIDFFFSSNHIFV